MGLRVLQHPANVIRCRFMVQSRHSLYTSSGGAFLHTLRTEGLPGLYRGFGTSSLQVVVQQAYIMLYEYLRASERYSSPVPEATRNGVAAGVSVFVAQVIGNPIDVMSQRLMLQGQTAAAPVTVVATAPVVPLQAPHAATMPAGAPPAAAAPAAAGTGAAGAACGPSASTAGAAAVAESGTHAGTRCNTHHAGAPDRPAAGPQATHGGTAHSTTQGSATASGQGNSNGGRLRARDVAAQVYAQRGARGFYAGFVISCLQFIPSASLWWYSYPIYRDALLSNADALLQPAARQLAALAVRLRESQAQPAEAVVVAGASSATATVEAAALANHAATAAPGARSRAAAAGQGPASGSSAAPRASSGGAFSDSSSSSVFVARGSEVLAGAFASATCAVALNPLDIVRTRAQVEGRAAMAVARHLLATEGLRGFAKGTTARIAMLTPQGALSVSAYEFVKRWSAEGRPVGAEVGSTPLV
jgi:hypothetical protein